LIALKTKEKVLFIFKQNSVRSQMSEALLKSSHGKFYDVYSAGSNPTNVNPHAIIVMSEIDIDISTNRSNKFEYF
jgi:arsenate reductase